MTSENEPLNLNLYRVIRSRRIHISETNKQSKIFWHFDRTIFISYDALTNNYNLLDDINQEILKVKEVFVPDSQYVICKF